MRFIAKREEGKRVFPARFRLDFGKGRSCGTSERTIVAPKSISSNNRDLSIRERRPEERAEERRREDEGGRERERKRSEESSKQGRGIAPARSPRAKLDEITASFLARDGRGTRELFRPRGSSSPIVAIPRASAEFLESKETLEQMLENELFTTRPSRGGVLDAADPIALGKHGVYRRLTRRVRYVKLISPPLRGPRGSALSHYFRRPRTFNICEMSGSVRLRHYAVASPRGVSSCFFFFLFFFLFYFVLFRCRSICRTFATPGRECNRDN